MRSRLQGSCSKIAASFPISAGGFNLGIRMRTTFERGTP
jgi:hypothetical protein